MMKDFLNTIFTKQHSDEQLFLGKYQLIEKLGDGGQGEVWKALDRWTFDRPVAIKQLKIHDLKPEEVEQAIEQFYREISILAHLDHPSIPKIYEIQVIDGMPHLIMQYIEGETLQQKLSLAREKNILCPFDLVSKLFLALCDVLEYLHMQNPPIIYRDLKPSNIMIDANWNIFLIDFGIARHFKKQPGKDTIAMGSSGYISPELETSGKTYPQSDIYALGIVLHYLLTNEDPGERPPFQKLPNVSLYYPKKSKQLDAFLHKMAALQIQERFQTIEEVMQEWHELLEKEQKIDAAHPIIPMPKKKQILLAALPLLVDDAPSDQAAIAELLTILKKDKMINLHYDVIASFENTTQKRQQFFKLLQTVDVVFLCITPELLHTTEGVWMIRRVLKGTAPYALLPLRQCQPIELLKSQQLITTRFLDQYWSNEEKLTLQNELLKAVKKFLQSQKEAIA